MKEKMTKEQKEILFDILEYLSYLQGEKALELSNKLYDEILKEEEMEEHEEKTDYLEEKLQVCGYSKDDLYELEYSKRG